VEPYIDFLSMHLWHVQDEVPFKFIMYYKDVVPKFETQGLNVNLLENIIWYALRKL